MFALCTPKQQGLFQGEHPEILAQSDPPPVDLSVGDIRSQIAAEWLQIAQRSQWRAYRKLPSLFRIVPSLTPYDLPFPKNGVPYAHKIREWPYLHKRSNTLHVWFYGRVFMVGGSNGAISDRPPSWIISNGHISATAHSIHLYSAHRAVILAIAQLSCSNLLQKARCLCLLPYVRTFNYFSLPCTVSDIMALYK